MHLFTVGRNFNNENSVIPFRNRIIEAAVFAKLRNISQRPRHYFTVMILTFPHDNAKQLLSRPDKIPHQKGGMGKRTYYINMRLTKIFF